MIRIVIMQSGAQSGAAQATRNAEQAAQNAERAAQTADQARANADRIIENAIQDAERAAQKAGSPGDRPIVISEDNGRPVTIDFRNGDLLLTQDGATKVIPLERVVPSGAVDIVQAIAAAIFFLVVGWPIARAIARWIDRKSQIARSNDALSQQIDARFAAMERNIDTVAIEVEKLSEAQRFTTKLIAERAERVPVSAQQN